MTRRRVPRLFVATCRYGTHKRAAAVVYVVYVRRPLRAMPAYDVTPAHARRHAARYDARAPFCATMSTALCRRWRSMLCALAMRAAYAAASGGSYSAHDAYARRPYSDAAVRVLDGGYFTRVLRARMLPRTAMQRCCRAFATVKRLPARLPYAAAITRCYDYAGHDFYYGHYFSPLMAASATSLCLRHATPCRCQRYQRYCRCCHDTMPRHADSK